MILYRMQLLLQGREKKQSGALLVEIWTLYVSDGLMGAIHGQFSEIEEMFVPALDLVINLHDKMNVFLNDGKRYKPVTMNHMGYGKVKSPKLVKTIILEGKDAEIIRNLGELQLLLKGVQKEAKNLVKNLLIPAPPEQTS